MKILLLLLPLFIFAQEIQYVKGDICVTDYWDERRTCKIVYYVDASEHILPKRCDNYEFVTDACTDNSRLAIDKSEFNALMALTANLLGFMMIFMIGLVIAG